MNIGSITIDKPLLLAPMDDITDIPFRLICREMGADIVCTEFTSCEAIIRGIPRALKRVQIDAEERPVGIQIFGSNAEAMCQAVEVIEKYNPDFIDINCGCWAKNHAQRGEGSGLLRTLPLLKQIVRAVVKATSVPVTVKTRLGWDKESIVIYDVARIVEQAGARALTIHCRTRTQAYKGQADWSWLPKIKKQVSIPVIGNGDVKSGRDVQALFDMGCDGVMIGRETISNPWIFQAAKQYLRTGEEPRPPTPGQRIELCLQHMRLAVRHKGAYRGLMPLRKHYLGYLRGFPDAARMRGELLKTKTLESMEQALLFFQETVASRDMDL